MSMPMSGIQSVEPILSVRDLRKHFAVRLGAFGEVPATVYALDRLTLDIMPGEALSLVGESGCGKSTAGFTILRLHEPTEGSVKFRGVDLTELSTKQMRAYRRHLQIVFQDPYSTLNPRMTVGQAIAEPIEEHRLRPASEISVRVTELLDDVGLPPAFADRYPHELSGGQRQRVVIARALACEPSFLVCDEAISALDVSVQAQIINLLQDIREKYGLTYLFIAHDLAVVRHISNRVAVMYLGRLAELGSRESVFERPLHPYTQALLSAVPEADPEAERLRHRQVLSGDVPSPLAPPSGCYFHTRCPLAEARCATETPKWKRGSNDQWVSCHLVPEYEGTAPESAADQ